MIRLRIALCLILSLIFLSSCAGTGTVNTPAPDVQTSVGGTLEKSPGDQDNTPAPDRLAGAKDAATAALGEVMAEDFGGMTFIITSTREGGVFGDSIGVTTVSQERHMRLKYLSERYNVNFVSVTDTADGIAKGLENEKKTGVLYSHLLYIEQRHIGTLSYNGLLGNIKSLPFVDLEKPYYDAEFVSEMQTPTGLWAIYGDACRDYESSSVVFYNEPLAKSLGIGELEELVYSGGWSLDKMTEYALIASGASTDENKLYGILDTDSVGYSNAAYVSSGADSVKLDGGKLSVIDNGDLLDPLAKKIREMTESGTYTAGSVDEDTAEGVFASGRGLFLISPIEAVTRIKDMPQAWGVLPIPTVSGAGHLLARSKDSAVICYSSSAPDVREIGIITEALFASSYKIIDAAYLDTYFHQYVRCEKGMDMFAYLFARERGDFALLFSEEFSNFGSATLGAFSEACSGGEDYSRIFARKRGSANRSLAYIK